MYMYIQLETCIVCPKIWKENTQNRNSVTFCLGLLYMYMYINIHVLMFVFHYRLILKEVVKKEEELQ